jgi:hypothetical protein
MYYLSIVLLGFQQSSHIEVTCVCTCHPLLARIGPALYDLEIQVVKVQIVSIDEAPNLRWEALPVRVER